MQAVSLQVHSAQTEIHPTLDGLLHRHFDHAWRQPVHAASVIAFDRLRTLIDSEPRLIVLDSGCGNGQSTLLLSQRHPDCWVIGVDQSALRLQRLAPDGVAQHGNAVLLRAELATFWRLFVAAGYSAARHYLLYPNPWPKPAQVMRRWHGHPVFPDLLRTARAFELRTNWRVYADEFAHALKFAGRETSLKAVQDEVPMTPFERKYRDSGHALWQVTTV